MTREPQMQRTPEQKSLFNQAIEFHKNDRRPEALEAYRLYLSQVPLDYQAWGNLGVLLRKMGKFAGAIAAHLRALELDPKNHTVRNNLINALVSEGEYDRAIAECAVILKDKPKDPEAFRLRLVALRCQGHHEQVLAELQAWEKLHGFHEKNRIQSALCRLTLGDYKGGFADFECRFAGGEVALPQNAPWPRWTGEDLKGKKIAVLPEQGMGDMIFMSRFLPSLKALGGEVHLLVKPPLLRFMQAVEGPDQVRGEIGMTEHFDYYTPIISLPHFLGFEGPQPPPAIRVNIPDDSRTRARRIVEPFRNRFRIGIVWTGSLTYPSNHKRSCSPEDFLGIARIPGVQLFSLYKGGAYEDFIKGGMAGIIVDACGDDRDLADAAAVIDEMDMLITTDTGVVHIAGTLGKENWNMLSAEGFWLYGLGDTTQWYPNMRIYRKDQDDLWPPVFASIEADLRQKLEAKALAAIAAKPHKKARHHG